MRQRFLIPVFAVLALGAAVSARQDARPLAAAAPHNTLTLGEFVVDPPTLINLGFE